VLLTGGHSRRFGRDKATFVVGGVPLAVRAARVLTAVCEPVVEAGPGVSGLPSAREDPPGTGPLAGLLAAADAFGVRGPVLVLACDMPRVGVALVRLLAEWPGEGSVVPTVGGRPQFACARWSAASLVRARASGRASLRALVGDDVSFVDERAWGDVAGADQFVDVDTPGDLASLGP
jgi:molybdopterin-guanine dinucleotide biosynthesis protein A